MRRSHFSIFLLLSLAVGLCACANHGSGTNTDASVYPHPGVEGLPPVPDQGGGPKLHPVGYFAYEIPIGPITFTVGYQGGFYVDVSAGIVTPLGDIRFGGGVAENASTDKPVPIVSVGVTQLIICQADSNQQICRGYAIRTGRKVRIALNGQFKETIDNGRVIINASPGSTVKVTDAGGKVDHGARPAARIAVEDFAFTVSGPYTNVDLEETQGGRSNDLSYDHVTGALQPINGAMVADIHHYAAASDNGIPQMNLPIENDCATISPDAWHRSFTATDLHADITVACIVTSERDFGYLVIGRDPNARPISYYVYSYIWVR